MIKIYEEKPNRGTNTMLPEDNTMTSPIPEKPRLKSELKPSPEVVVCTETLKQPVASQPSEGFRGGRRNCLSVRGEIRDEPASAVALKEEVDCGRERLKRHRIEMAGRVWIPDIWGQESLLKDWIDCSPLDTCLVPKGLLLARQALVEECRRAAEREPALNSLRSSCS